ncbi:PHD finger protein EHD3 [Camellia lanceoleosa]|nr:PHD finger protein EHD3 [Camellia lanceoleosa]
MVEEDRESNGVREECGGGVMEWSGDAMNGFATGVENGVVGDGNSAGLSCNGFRTYKRRRHAKMGSSETKLVEYGKVAADSVNQLPDKTVEPSTDKVLHNCSYEQVSHPRMDSLPSDDCQLIRWRKIVLEQMNQSFCESEGGLQGCIQEALKLHPVSGCRTAAKLWTKLQKVGADMVSLAKSLSDKSRTSYHEQFLTEESDLQSKLDLTEACGVYKVSVCWRCGEKADGRECLVCDSCEEMYHVSCIEPAIEEIPLKSWYCAKCTVNGIESPHDNCVVCEKLNASRPANNGVGDDDLTNDDTELDENSNGLVEHGLQLSKGGKNIHRCNFCQCVVDNGEKFKVCGHPYCPHQYYHVKCLTPKQLGTYGPRWYCPSCLCRACLTDQDDEKIVLCDVCDHAYHIYCMQPPRNSVPRGKWFCKKCDAGIRQIRKVKKAYENVQNKLKKSSEDGSGAFENPENEQKESEELINKSGGVDMLLTAAKTLNYEEKMAAIETKN